VKELKEIWEKLEDHEKRLRKLEDTMAEIRGELRINTALTLTILGAILTLIILVV